MNSSRLVALLLALVVLTMPVKAGVAYKNLTIHGSPTGPAGIALDANFTALADRTGSYLEAAGAPDLNDDINAATPAYVNSVWKDTDTSRLYRCIDNTDGAAVWRETATGSPQQEIVPSGSTIQAIIDDVIDATVSKPYVVVVPPGVYTEQITMKDYVSLRGAGIDVTVIQNVGSAGNDYATVFPADNVTISDMTIKATGSGMAIGTWDHAGLIGSTWIIRNVKLDATWDLIYSNQDDITVYVYDCIGVSYFDGFANQCGTDGGNKWYIYNTHITHAASAQRTQGVFFNEDTTSEMWLFNCRITASVTFDDYHFAVRNKGKLYAYDLDVVMVGGADLDTAGSDVVGVNSYAATSETYLFGGSITTSNAGDQTATDIKQGGGGVLEVSGTKYSTSSGTITGYGTDDGVLINASSISGANYQIGGALFMSNEGVENSYLGVGSANGDVGNHCLFDGYHAGYNNDTSGTISGYNESLGTRNIYIGARAGAGETSLTGTVTGTYNSTAIVGDGTLFDSEVIVGDIIRIEYYYSGAYGLELPDYGVFEVAAIADDTHLTLDSNFLDNTLAGLSAVIERGSNEGSENIGIGHLVLVMNTEGYECTAVGDNALQWNTTGRGSCAFGNDSMQGTAGVATTGSFNSAFGTDTMYYVSSGGYNAAFGYQALRNLNTSMYCAAFGYRALFNTTDQDYSSAFGFEAGAYNTRSNILSFGFKAGKYNTGNYHTGIGNSAGLYNEGEKNTAIGYGAWTTFVEDGGSAVNFDNTDVDVANDRVTVTSHGLGANDAYLNLKFDEGTSSLPGITDGSVHQWQIVDANTLEVITDTITGQGTGTGHTLTPQVIYTNTTVLGYNAEPDASNQIMLGDANVTEVRTVGSVRIASDTELFKAGAATTDYTFGWDGDDAVHSITAGQFNFTGGNFGIDESAAGAPIHIRKDATTASSPLELLRLEVEDTGVELAAGMGGEISWYAPHGTASFKGGFIQVVKASASDFNEATTMIFGTTANEGSVREVGRIDADGDWGFGGVTSPQAAVHARSNASHFGIVIEENSGSESWSIGVDADGNLNFHDSGGATPAVTFQDATGYVGIGTVTPSLNLEVNASHAKMGVLSDLETTWGVLNSVENNDTRLVFGDRDNNRKLHFDSSTHFPLTNVVTHMTIQSTDGNVGIGTVTPAAFLEINPNTVLAEALILQAYTTIDTPDADEGNTGSTSVASGGIFTGLVNTDYKIEIDDGDPTDPNEFKWSDDDGATWEAENVAVTGSAQTLNNGVTITFSATTGSDTGDIWTFEASRYQGNLTEWQNAAGSIISVVDEESRFGVGTATPTSALQMGDDRLIAVDVNAGLTASTNQAQGQGALTAQVNEISTVANDDDTVTLPTAVTGIVIEIINNGAKTLQIFPASGDDLGLGVNNAEELEANERVAFVAYDTTNWAKESTTEIIHAEIHDEDNTDAFVINDAGGDFHSYHTNGFAAGDLADWAFDAGGAGTSFPIASIANSIYSPDTYIIVTTTGAHGLAVGDIVSQTNLADAAYVGIFEVAVTESATTYEVAASYTADGTGTMDQAATLEADAVAAGVYSFAYYVSATLVGNNETFDFQLYRDATAVTGSKVRRKFSVTNDFGSMAGGGVVPVGSGEKISFALSNEDSAANIIIRNVTIVLIRL